MIKKLLAGLTFLMIAHNLNAQDSLAPYSYGIFLGGAFNIHSADFRAIPDCPNCSPGFEDGFGFGFNLGALFEYKLAPQFSIGTKLSYVDNSAVLKREESLYVVVNNRLTEGTFEHSIDATLSTIGIEPYGKYEIFNKFNVNFGIFAGTLIKKDYSQKEEITKPSGVGTFADEYGNDTRTRVRNKLSGELKSASSFMLSPFVGVSYTLPLNKKNNLNLEPSAAYYLALTNVIDAPEVNKWKANYVNLGVALRYTPIIEREFIRQNEKIQKIDTLEIQNDRIANSYVKIGSESSKIEEKQNDNILLTIETISRTDTLFTQKKHTLYAEINAVGIDEKGNEIKSPKFVVEEYVSNKLKPLLNYVFFDENSDRIPERMHSLNNSEKENFSVNGLYNYETLDIYYHLLNIIGKRLTDNPKANIRLVGCNADINNEKGALDLSQRRAENVKNYLTETWKIDEKRIKITTQNLPQKASLPMDELEKAQENRRVEIYSDNDEIVSPVFLADTIRSSNPPIARFYPYVNSSAGVKGWTITANQNSGMNNFEKSGVDLPKFIDWELAKNEGAKLKENQNITYSISTVDAVENKYESDKKSLPLELITISKKRENRIDDKIIENFSLILFDFNKSDIAGINKQIIDLIKSRIQTTSTVTIDGYTDKLGEDDYNQSLSERRALNAKKALGDKPNYGAQGFGESKVLYDNNIPEGRFYSRTVDIKIETPVAGE